ncbi:hypothetical protein XPR_2261 [Xanthomonas arboricola pv. pruni MAFF 301420]|uniref:Copper homeostasis protein n=2 Tax=Xanthomonas arboricola pv. pruni TaxID=69929 RepID=W4SGH4_9XANT|nr:hypothetical protein XPU_2550 [Xanthomonas arboricola pv. pruni str. MAFF 311562]GAE55626.1 hypothetical protein XPR_2261 [Xanthomonas arboricola pv. pruni MAFF 301420]
MLRCLLRLLLCLCLVANTATGAWASVGMAMPEMASAGTVAAASMVHASMPAAMPCHADMPPPAATHPPDKTQHAHVTDCCKLGSCDCLQHCSLALLTLPAVPAGLPGRATLPATLAEGAAVRCPNNRFDLPSPER